MLQSWVHRSRPSQDSQTSTTARPASAQPEIHHKRSFSAALPSDLTSRVGRAISTSSLYLSSSPTQKSASPSPTKQNPSHTSSASVPYLGPNGGTNGGSYYNDDDSSMSTIPDPRSRALSPSSIPGSPMHTPHPDLSEEVASLSNKLINAINHQTNLDDTLNATRQQLSASQDRCKALELAAQDSKDGREEMEELIRMGTLVYSSDVAAERKRLIHEAAEEVKKRIQAEKERADIESELENLTTALFEEANKMVITAREEARRDHMEMEKKNDVLEKKLRDTEALLKLHQEELRQLKGVMEKMDEELVVLNTRQSEELSRKSAASSIRTSQEIKGVDGTMDRVESPAHEAIIQEVRHTLEEAPAVCEARRSVEEARLSLEQVQLEKEAAQEKTDPTLDNREEVVQKVIAEVIDEAEAKMENKERIEAEESKSAADVQAQMPKSSGMQMHL